MANPTGKNTPPDLESRLKNPIPKSRQDYEESLYNKYISLIEFDRLLEAYELSREYNLNFVLPNDLIHNTFSKYIRLGHVKSVLLFEKLVNKKPKFTPSEIQEGYQTCINEKRYADFTEMKNHCPGTSPTFDDTRMQNRYESYLIDGNYNDFLMLYGVTEHQPYPDKKILQKAYSRMVDQNRLSLVKRIAKITKVKPKLGFIDTIAYWFA